MRLVVTVRELDDAGRLRDYCSRYGADLRRLRRDMEQTVDIEEGDCREWHLFGFRPRSRGNKHGA